MGSYLVLVALIPPYFLDCVLAIAAKDSSDAVSWIGSGFLYGVRIEHPATESKYAVYLVTNRHVRHGLKDRDAFVRCNPVAGEAYKDYTIVPKDDKGNDLWTEHPDSAIDVAVVNVDVGKLRNDGMRVGFISNDSQAATVSRMRDELGLSEGDFCYVLGFPMGLAESSNTVIARGGVLARVRDMFVGKSREYLIDSQVFPGNSGGPVISKPELVSITGTKSQTAAYLIGLVHSNVSYLDVAVSNQTGRARVSFEENSGLAAVHAVDCIDEAIDVSLPKLGFIRRGLGAATPSSAQPT